MTRSRATTRNSPTPAATVRISVRLGMAGTCPANTVRSGSATVMSIPRRNAAARGSSLCLARLMVTPMALPMGVMDISTPRVNIPTPTINRNEPKRNMTNTPGVRGTMVMLSAITMAVMGSTEDRDSLIFSSSWGLMRMGGSFPAPRGLVFPYYTGWQRKCTGGFRSKRGLCAIFCTRNPSSLPLAGKIHLLRKDLRCICTVQTIPYAHCQEKLAVRPTKIKNNYSKY